MANSWDSFAVTFTNSFNNAQRQAAQEEAEVQNPFMQNLMKEYDKARAAIQASNTEQAEYISGGKDIVAGMAGISSDFSVADLESYASTLLAANGGDMAKARQTLIDQLNTGVLVTRGDLDQNKEDVVKGMVSPVPEQPGINTAQAEAETASMLEDESSDAVENTPTPASAAEVNTPQAASGINLGANLPDLDVEEVTYGDKFSSFYGGLLGGDKDGYNKVLLREAHTKFRDFLESTGQLDTYNKIRTGELTYKPFSMRSNIVLDVSKVGKQPLPPTHSITSLNEVIALQAGIDAGQYQDVPPEQQAAINTLAETFKTTTAFGLPEDPADLKSEVQIRSAQALIGVAQAQGEELPPGYVTAVNAMYGALDNDGSVSTAGLLSSLSSTFETLEGETPDDYEERVGVYLNGPSITSVLQAVTFTDERSITKLTQLNTVKDRLGDLKTSFMDQTGTTQEAADKLFQGSFDAVDARINMVKSSEFSGKHPGGKTETKVVQDENGNWSAVSVLRSMNTEGKSIYTDPNSGEALPTDRILNIRPEALDQRRTINNQYSAEIEKYGTSLVGVTEFLGLQGEMIELVVDNPTLITAPVTSAVATFGNALSNEIDAATTLVSRLIEDDGFKQQFQKGFTDPNATVNIDGQEINSQAWVNRSIASITQEIDNLIAQESSKPLANQAAQFEMLKARQLLATFKMGVLEGQSGTALSNRDFERLIQILNAKTVKGFMENMKSYGSSIINSMETRHSTLVNAPEIRTWETENGISFFPEGSKPTSLGERYGFDEKNPLALTPYAKTAYGIFTGREAPAREPEQTRAVPTLEQFLEAAKAAPQNAGVSEQDLTNYYLQNYGN